MLKILITDCACAVISLVHFYCEKHTGNIRFFKHRKRQYLPHFSSVKVSDIMNQAFSSLHEVLFEIAPESSPCIMNLK